MRASLFLFFFIVTTVVLPVAYAILLTKFGTISFLPLILVLAVIAPIIAHVISMGGANKMSGFKGGKLARQLFWATLLYYVIIFGITLAAAWFFLPGRGGL